MGGHYDTTPFTCIEPIHNNHRLHPTHINGHMLQWSPVSNRMCVLDPTILIKKECSADLRDYLYESNVIYNYINTFWPQVKDRILCACVACMKVYLGTITLETNRCQPTTTNNGVLWTSWKTCISEDTICKDSMIVCASFGLESPNAYSP